MVYYHSSSYMRFIPFQAVARTIANKGRTPTSVSLPQNDTRNEPTDTDRSATQLIRFLSIPGTCYKLNNDIKFPLKGNQESIASTVALLETINSTGIARIAWRGNGGNLSIHVKKFTEFSSREDEEVHYIFRTIINFNHHLLLISLQLLEQYHKNKNKKPSPNNQV